MKKSQASVAIVAILVVFIVLLVATAVYYREEIFGAPTSVAGITSFEISYLDEDELIHRTYDSCKLDFYHIDFVDELVPKHCYAMKQKDEFWDYERLNASFKYAGKDAMEIWENEENSSCRDIVILGEMYCLKDESMCMTVEDGKICELINLTGKA